MYPVTTPFGQVAGYPLNNGFHNGIDYGFPMGTPVVVNGVTIGLSNNTGATTGPHLHVGKYVNGAVQDPGVGNGFKFNSAVVYDTGSDSTNGNFVRITGDGALWNYLHLESILVTKGQILKGVTMTPDSLNALAQAAWNKDASDGEVQSFIKAYDGHDPLQTCTDILHSATNIDLRNKAANFDNIQTALSEAYTKINQLEKPDPKSQAILADLQATINKYK